MSEARKHHPYSPSKLQCLEACPVFESKQSINEASRMGTAQHAVADSGIDDPTIPDYRAVAAAECMRFTDNIVKKYPGGTVLKEEYLPVDEEHTTAGYLDFGIISADGTVAEIVDYKFGQNAVEDASNNLQGIAYMLGLYRKFPKLQTCTISFILPHRDEINTHTFTSDQFSGLYLRVVNTVRRAVANRNDFSKASPTVGTCLFCANVGRCEAVTGLVIKLGRKFAPLQIPENVTPSLILDPQQVSQGIKLAQVVSAWADAFRAQATAKTIEDPSFVPEGYTLVHTQKRKVVNARNLGELAKALLPESDHVKLEALYEIPISKVEKLISTAAPRGQKDSTVEEFGKRAIEAGVVELGTPYAFLRMARKTDSGSVSDKE